MYAAALLVYGDEKPENAAFIKMRDLISQDFAGMGQEPKVKFLGEVKFDTELSFLMGGREKTVVYFTQGHREADLADSFKPGGVGKMKQRLEKRNFEVKALNFEGVNPKVPDDAKVVVVANPRQPWACMQENTAFSEAPDFAVGLPGSSLWQEAGSAGYRPPRPVATTRPVVLMAPWASIQACPRGVNEPVTL